MRYEKDDVKKMNIKLGWGQLTMATESVEKLQIVATGDEETVKELRIYYDDDEVFVEQPQYGLSASIVSSRWLEVVVRLPIGWKIDIEARTITGNINMKEIVGKEIEVETVSGKLMVDGMACEEMKIKTISGKTKANQLSCENIKVRTVSGDVVAEDIICKELSIRSVSGGMTFHGLSCQRVTCTSVSGKYLMHHTNPFKSYNVNTVSSEVALYAPIEAVSISQRGLKGNIRTEGVREEATGERIELTTVTGSTTIVSTLS